MLQGRFHTYLVLFVHLLCCGWGNFLYSQTPPFSLEVQSLDPEASAGQPLRLSIRALNANGAPNESWQGSVTLRALVPGTATPVLSEINRVAGFVEVTNPGDQVVDVSGWELQAWSPQFVSNLGNLWTRIPEGSAMPGQSVFTWTPSSSTSNAFPFLTGSHGQGTTLAGNALFRLVDARGKIVDQVWMGTPTTVLPGMDLRGPNLFLTAQGGSVVRQGQANHWTSQDWTVGEPTPGAINSNLRLPWESLQVMDLATVQITRGAWIGEVLIPPVNTSWLRLQADDGAGLLTTTDPLPAHRRPQLTLTLPPGASQVSEAPAGPLGEMVISVPATLTSPVTVTLHQDASGEFAWPSSVTLHPGSLSASVPISNLNDGVPDGDALVTLTATAPGFEPAVVTLVNRDAQAIHLTVLAPGSLREDLGFSLWNGEVLLPFMATHSVSVHLEAEPPLSVPREVVIRPGTRSASFSIRCEDDSVGNFQPYRANIFATTGSGNVARSTVSIVDTERQSYQITFPNLLIEGATTNGHIHLTVPHGTDFHVPLSSSSPRLLLPKEIVVPAGILDLDFTVTAPDDSSTNGVERVSAIYSLADSGPQFIAITILDDEVEVHEVGWGSAATCFLNSVPTSALALIRNRSGTIQRFNGPGTIDLSDTALATITTEQPLQFTNGLWSGTVHFHGEGLNLPTTLSAAGTTSSVLRVDVLAGSLLSTPVVDIAGTPGASKLLALTAPTNSTPALLMEVDAILGTTNRILALPRRANRIALSADGAVAWLASATGTLQRVDVSAWQFDREVTLSNIVSSPRPLDVTVLPGSRDRVAIIVAGSTPNATSVAWLENGTQVGNTVGLAGSTTNLRLIPGRDSNEVFSHNFSSLSRYRLRPEGVVLEATKQLPNPSSEQPNLSLSGNLLLHGDGAVFQADTLSQILERSLPEGLTTASETRSLQLLVDRQSVSVTARTLAAWAPLPGHNLPYRPAKGSRLVRWGSRGLAYIEAAEARLVMLETPLLEPQQPSLGLYLDPLTNLQLANSTTGYLPALSQLSYVISNSGPIVARGNTLESTQSPYQSLLIPDLAPGESSRVSLPLTAFQPGRIIRVRTAIRSASGTTSSNSVLETVLRFHDPAQAGVRELIYGATAIAGNPTGDRLYASISRLSGDTRDGVAILDPETGDELAFLKVVGTPGKLRTSEDGSRLYAIVGTNKLVRWNLATGLEEVSIQTPNDAVLDFQPVVGNPRSVVVATTTQVALYTDADALPLAVSAETSDSRLTYSGTNLWSYTPTTLRRLSVTAHGLVTELSSFTLPTSFGDPFFLGDGEYLYAIGRPLHIDTMTLANGYPEASSLVIDQPSGELLGSSEGVLRRIARPTFSTLESQAFSPRDKVLGSPVLWGDDGIAVLVSSQQILLIHSPLRHRGAEADLGVSITPPADPVAEESAIWHVSVTNRSASASGPVRLSVRAVGSPVGPFSFEGLNMIARMDEFEGILPSVPAYSQAVLLVHAIPLNGGSRMEASILSTSPDPTVEDHSAVSDTSATYPEGDLALLTSVPHNPVQVGFPSQFLLTVSNGGPTTVRQTVVNVPSGETGIKLSNFECEGCQAEEFDGTLSILTQPLEPRQTWTLRFDATATLPGIHEVRAYMGGWLRDLNPDNNGTAVNLVTETQAAAGILADLGYSGVARVVWSASRDQLLLLPKSEPALWLVDPETIAPTNRITLPRQPTEVSACDDGIHAWVLTTDRLALLVNLNTSRIERSFAYDPAGGVAIGLATPPGSYETVVLAILVSAADPGEVVLRQFVKGLPVGAPLTEVPTGFVWTKCLFLKNGELVVQTPGSLRTYSLSPAGFQPRLNLDAAASYSLYPDDPMELDGGLMLRRGLRVRFDTQSVDIPLGNNAVYVLDEAHGLVLRARLHNPAFGKRSLRMEGFDPVSQQLRYSADIESPGLFLNPETTHLVTLGGHGVLILSDWAQVFRLDAGEPTGVRLSAGFQSAETVELSPADLELTLSVTNSATWATRRGTIDIRLAPGMTFSPDSIGAGTNQLQLPLDGFLGVTNFVFKVRSTIDGDATVTAALRSDPPDVSGSEVTTGTTVYVLPPPMLLFPDVVLREGTAPSRGSLALRLSRPMPQQAEVHYTASFGTADSSDITAQFGSVVFPPRQTLATLSLVVRDSLPEWDETLRLHLTSTDVPLLQPEVEITLMDDDVPTLTANPVSVVEGNEAGHDLEVKLTLSRPTPRPVQARYATVGGTAVTGQDFLPRAGWVNFESGQTSAIVRIPIVGDARLEPNEIFTLSLEEVTNALNEVSEVAITILNDDLRPVIRAISVDGLTLTLSFDSAASTTYQVQFTTDVNAGAWTPLPKLIEGTGKVVTTSIDLSPEERRFFRILSQ